MRYVITPTRDSNNSGTEPTEVSFWVGGGGEVTVELNNPHRRITIDGADWRAIVRGTSEEGSTER
jgi:hypothetical protein